LFFHELHSAQEPLPAPCVPTLPGKGDAHPPSTSSYWVLRLTSLSYVKLNKRTRLESPAFVKNGVYMRRHHSTKSFSVCQQRFAGFSLLFQRAMCLPSSISYAPRRLLVRMDTAVPLKENA
jgi:hypothetical protein